jgi:hypothetical protein
MFKILYFLGGSSLGRLCMPLCLSLIKVILQALQRFPFGRTALGFYFHDP